MEHFTVATAYMWAAVVLVVFFLIAVLIANMTLSKPGKPVTTTLRVWFWVLCVCTPVVAFLINFMIANGIENTTHHSDYFKHSCIASLIVFVLFIVFGVIISKIFKNKRVGLWF